MTFKGISLKIVFGDAVMKACTFIGHKDFSTVKYKDLFAEVERLIIEENVIRFYVGTHGNFDKMSYQVLSELEKYYDIDIIVVLAYLNINKDEIFFDISKTVFPQILEKTPPRYAISARNKYMIKKCQYMICGVNNTFSNSYNFVEYAMKRNIKIKNIGAYKIER